MNKVHYSSCPVCDSTDIEFKLTVKDHSVSGEIYLINECNNCSLRFTQDVPSVQDIAPYYESPDYISHSNTNKGMVNRLYQVIRKFTLEAKAALIKQYAGKKGSILDIGAGIGAFLNTMQKKDWKVTGIEPDAGARQQAAKLFNLTLNDLEGFKQLAPEHFNAITMWHVLEHVHELHPYMENLKLLLKKEGRLFIAVPNYRSVDASIYKENWAAYDVPRHLYHFSPRSMEILTQKHGMSIIAKKPMWFDSFYISLISSKYKNGKIKWLSSLANGLNSNLKALSNNNYCSSLIYIISKN